MKKTILSFVVISLFVLPQIVFAQGLKDAFDTGSGSKLGTVASKSGFEAVDDLGIVSGQIINTALTLVGLIFLILMVYAGYLWMTARGEEDQVKKAQKIVTGSVIGLVLVLSAYAITIFVTTSLGGK